MINNLNAFQVYNIYLKQNLKNMFIAPVPIRISTYGTDANKQKK